MTSFVFLSLGALGFASSILLLHGPDRTDRLLFGIGPGTRVAEGSQPINIEMSFSFLNTRSCMELEFQAVVMKSHSSIELVTRVHYTSTRLF